MRTKFETVEHEPVFEEDIHGPLPQVDEHVVHQRVYHEGHDDDGAGYELEKEDTMSSTGSGSVEDEEAVKK